MSKNKMTKQGVRDLGYSRKKLLQAPPPGIFVGDREYDEEEVEMMELRKRENRRKVFSR